MPLYSYKTIHRSGKAAFGERTAKNEEELRKALRSEGVLVVRIEDTAHEKSISGFFQRFSEKFEKLIGVSLFEKLIFSRNLAVMIHAGLPLTRALSTMADEIKNQSFKTAIKHIAEAITSGKSLTEALSEHKDIFNDLFINMVQAGETSGKLDQVLNLLARQMKKDYVLRSRVKGAMIYPAIIVTALLGIAALMMIYVVPTLSQALKDLNVPLPWSTQLIIFISDLFVGYSVWVLGIAIVIMGAFIRFIRSRSGKPLWDAIVLKIPLFGPLIKKMNIARIMRVLAYLLESGVPIIRSLEIAAAVVGNSLYKDSMGELGKSVAKGGSIGVFFHAHSKLYEPLAAEMVSAGEESGKISEMLLEVATFFEQDITATTKNLSSIIEPFLMIFIGAMVGFFALSILQPIYGSLGGI